MKRPSGATLFVIFLCSALGAAALVGSAWLLSRFMLRVQRTSEHTVTVKGVAEKQIDSDLGCFRCTVSCKAENLKDGYRELERLGKVLDQKLAELGFSAAEQDECTIDYSEISKTVRTKENNREISKQIFSHYLFQRSCRIRSTKVAAIASASLKLYELTAAGINISIGAPEYFISSPEQYKLQLVDAAACSAHKRADQIARTSGAELGKLLTARQGVIQITRPADNTSSDGGTYDTRSIPKIMRMVVTLTFALK